MEDRTRRTELGKMLLDVTKYLLTIAVVGGLISEKIQVEMIFLGLALSIGVGGIGVMIIPPEENAP